MKTMALPMEDPFGCGDWTKRKDQVNVSSTNLEILQTHSAVTNSAQVRMRHCIGEKGEKYGSKDPF